MELYEKIENFMNKYMLMSELSLIQKYIAGIGFGILSALLFLIPNGFIMIMAFSCLVFSIFYIKNCFYIANKENAYVIIMVSACTLGCMIGGCIWGFQYRNHLGGRSGREDIMYYSNGRVHFENVRSSAALDAERDGITPSYMVRLMAICCFVLYGGITGIYVYKHKQTFNPIDKKNKPKKEKKEKKEWNELTPSERSLKLLLITIIFMLLFAVICKVFGI